MDYQHIPEKFRPLVKEAVDFSGVWRGAKNVATSMAPYAAGMLLAAGTAGLSGYFSARRRYQEAVSSLRASHDTLTGNPEYRSNPTKYTERFKELSLISPTLASNPSLAHKVIASRLDDGFTVDDIHRIASIEHLKTNTSGVANPAGTGMYHFTKNLESIIPIAVPAAFGAYERHSDLEGHYQKSLGDQRTQFADATNRMSADHAKVMHRMAQTAADTAVDMAGAIATGGHGVDPGTKERLRGIYTKKFDENFNHVLAAMEKERDMEKKSSAEDVTLRVSEECMGRMLGTRYAMYKEAGIISGAKGLLAPVGKVLKSSGNATTDYLKIMSVPLAIGIGFSAINKMMQARGNKQLEAKADHVFASIMRTSDIAKENREIATEAFDSLKSFAPVLAAKPIVAKTFIEHIVQSGGRLGPETAGMLSDTQSRIQDVANNAGGRPGSGFFAGLKDPMAAFSVKMPGGKQ